MRTHEIGPYTIHVVYRDEWDVLGRQRGVYIGPGYFKALVPHHTVTGFVRAYYELAIEKMRWLQRLRPDLGNDIPYNFVIFAGKDAHEAWVVEGRGIGWTGAHTSGYNSSTHAASFWGNSITDPVEPAVLEAFRLVGRMMLEAGCPVTEPTKDHGSYPDQGTACAGTKIRAALSELQPPFNPQGLLTPPVLTKKEKHVYTFHLRPGPPFAWEGYPEAVSYDSAVVDHGDEITVSLTGEDRRDRNCTVIHANGAQETKLVGWGAPASFVALSSGWTAVLVGADAVGKVRVEGRG